MKTLLLFLVLTSSVFTLAADGKSVSYKSGDETVNGMIYTTRGQRAVPCPDRDP